MYLEPWGLTESPFRGGPDVARYYPSATHEESLARIYFLADGRRRVGVLTGAPGSGKSLTLAMAARQLARAGFQVASVNLLGREPSELLAGLLAAWGLPGEPGDPLAALWRTVEDALAVHRLTGIHDVLLLDDADEAPGATLAAIERVVHLGRDQTPPLTLILAACMRRVSRLGRRLLDIAELHIALESWELAETRQYLETAVNAPNGGALFRPEASVRVHELAGGLPRLVNNIADLALTAAAGQGRDQVDADLVNAAYEELSVEAATPLEA